ncbi:MAG: beta-lactamase family protein [Proteobacteria bacterium]|nr:beta-lactamase family protein [Pseudomonadota bacterium]
MIKCGDSKEVTGFRRIILLSFATISIASCEPRGSISTGPVELPTADASQAGFSVERLQHLSDTLDQLLQDNGAPGAVALILRDGHVVYEHAFGHRTPAHEQAMITDTIFRIYSMTKPIVSVAVMMLWEDSAFKLDDPIGLYLPEFNAVRVAVYDETGSNIVDTEATKRPITIRDLLRHTAGMTYGIFGAMTPVKQQYLDADLALDTFDGDAQQWIETVAKIPLEAHPGDRWQYSPATVVLGRLVETVTGQTLGDFLRERLFDALDMRDTGFYIPESKHDRMAEGIGQDLRGHFQELHKVATPPKFQAGDGGLVSTARDYARFFQMMLNGGELHGVRLLQAATVDMMTSDHLGPTIDVGPLYLPGPGYGFGLGFSVRLGQDVSALPGSPGEYGWGGLAGTMGRIDPQEQLVIVFMVQDIPNLNLYRRQFSSLTYAAMIREQELRD